MLLLWNSTSAEDRTEKEEEYQRKCCIDEVCKELEGATVGSTNSEIVPRVTMHLFLLNVKQLADIFALSIETMCGSCGLRCESLWVPVWLLYFKRLLANQERRFLSILPQPRLLKDICLIHRDSFNKSDHWRGESFFFTVVMGILFCWSTCHRKACITNLKCNDANRMYDFSCFIFVPISIQVKMCLRRFIRKTWPKDC